MEGIEECAEDAEVVLKQNGSELARVTTDIFGEFKIDKLEKKSGQYELEVSSDSSGSISVEFDLDDESLYLGTMKLSVGVGCRGRIRDQASRSLTHLTFLPWGLSQASQCPVEPPPEVGIADWPVLKPHLRRQCRHRI